MPTVSKAQWEHEDYSGFEAELIMIFGEILNTTWHAASSTGLTKIGYWHSIVLLREIPQTSFATFDTGIYLCTFPKFGIYECTRSVEATE